MASKWRDQVHLRPMSIPSFTTWITGASSGIGEATALALSSPGAHLVLVARRADRLAGVAAACEAKGARVHQVLGDVREVNVLYTQLAALPAPFSEPDVLVNNAGLALGLDKAQAASGDAWRTMIDTNVISVVELTRLTLPGMVARKRGHVVFIGSIAGHYPYPGGNVYGATKSFVEHFALNLRADLLGTGVRVTNVAPGAVNTEFSTVRFAGDAARADAFYKDFEPMVASDVAECVRWVVSLPAHVNVNTLEVMPTAQANGPFIYASNTVR